MSRHDPIVRVRHMLDHAREAYDTVNFDIIWTIVQDDLPPLIEQLEAIIEEET